jgi:hypothetical protein
VSLEYSGVREMQTEARRSGEGAGRRSWVARAACGILVLAGVAACSAGEASPTESTYTVKFPSTAAAVATDFVQLFVFDVDPAEREVVCQNLVAARKRKEPLKPVVTGPQVNVCEMLRGAKPITVPYGEKAVLAVALRGADDFLTGCVLQTFGDGTPLLSIPVSLVDLATPVPPTTCNSVGDRCNQVCKAN